MTARGVDRRAVAVFEDYWQQLADGAQVLAKIEGANPANSVKDRIGAAIIDAAVESGELKPGGTIVEPTSGNTGVGLALVAQERGYRCIFVCPDKVGKDKIDVLRAYGAEVQIVPTSVAPDHPDSYYSVSDRLTAEIEGAWKPNQFFNLNGPQAHYESTGPEIWEQTDGQITHLVAGIGTGGTITGTGRYLKEVSADRPSGPVRVIGADPSGSVYSGGAGRPYFVEGVGEDMWVDNYDPAVPDEVIAVEDAEALAMTRRLAAGDTSMDIMSLDPPFVPELAEPGFLAPVPEEMQAYAKDNALEGALAAASWKDELVTVPFWANTQLLWYRKSASAAAGVDPTSPTFTWDEMLKAAVGQQKKIAVQAQRYEGYTV